jgi:hypothetical protein
LAGITAFEVPTGELPRTFVARTVNVYDVPFVRPVMVHEVSAVVQPKRPTVEATVYNVIADPLLFAAVQEIVTWPSPRVATTFVGASGRPAGVTALDTPATELPTAFVATTEKV